MPNKFKECIIIVEPTINDVDYSRALRRILSEKIVSDVIVTFLDSTDSKICGEIKSFDVNANQSRRGKKVLILNENSSHDSVTAALNWVANSKESIEHKTLVENNSSIKLRSAY